MPCWIKGMKDTPLKTSNVSMEDNETILESFNVVKNTIINPIVK